MIQLNAYPCSVLADRFRGLLRSTLVVGVLALAACGGGSGGDGGGKGQVAPPPATLGSATLGAAGGVVEGPDGSRLVVSAGGVDDNLTFRITRDAVGAPPLEGLNPLSAVFAVTPHGQSFGAGALFSIALPGNIPAGATPVLLKAEPGGNWRVMNNVSTDPTRLAAEIGGLSYFVVGTCSSVVTDFWTIVGEHCPSGHELRLTMFDGLSPVQVLRGPDGVQLPLWYVTDTPQTRTFTLQWTRPPGTNRTDQIGVVGVPGGFNGTGFRSNWGNPAVDDVNNNDYSRTFTVTIDPARVAGASSPNGRLLRVKATASYGATAFRVGQGNVQVGFEFETDIPILVRYANPQPVITRHPVNVGVVAGQPATFNVAATGASLSYRWSGRANLNAAFAPIAGATLPSYTPPTPQLGDHGAQFLVEVCSASNLCVTSNTATLLVTQTSVEPSWVIQPLDMSVVVGQTASFTVTAFGSPPPSIRWQQASAGGAFFDISVGEPRCVTTPPPSVGAQTAATCSVGPFTVNNSGQRYRAVAFNAATPAGVFSNPATLTVTAVPTAPTITRQPMAQSTTVGGSATFSVGATGTASLDYIWWHTGFGALPAAGGHVSGANCSFDVSYSLDRSSVTLSNLTAGCDGGDIGVTVRNGVDPQVNSTSARLTVTPATLGLALLAGAIGGLGMVDGARTVARVQMSPRNGIAFDAVGNAYFNDPIAGRVRKISTAGVVSTLAGAGTPLRGNDGGIAVDSGGNVYLPERAVGNRILQITPAGVVSVWVGAADGLSNFIHSVAIDADDNLYAAESWTGGSRRIFKITPTRVVTILHDFGANPDDGASALAVDAGGNVFAVGNGALFGTIVRIARDGTRTTLAGAPGEQGNRDDLGAAARFAGINGLAIVANGDLYATDGNNYSVRRITQSGEVTTVSGAFIFPVSQVDGTGTAARYAFPGSIAAAPNGDLLIGDVATIRRLTTTATTTTPTFEATTFVGSVLQTGNTDGSGGAARFSGFVSSVVLDAAGNGNAYVADNSRIRIVTPSGMVTTLVVMQARQLALDGTTGLFVASSNAVWRVSFAGVATLLAGNPQASDYVDDSGADARFGDIGGLAVDSAGNVYVTERINQNSTIRHITPGGVVSTWAGVRGDSGAGDGSLDGVLQVARFSSPTGLAFDAAGNLFVADSGNNSIRHITAAGQVSTLAGAAGTFGSADGIGASARFWSPTQLAVDPNGNLLVADHNNSTLRRIAPRTGEVTTVLGAVGENGVVLGAAARLNRVAGLAVRPSGRIVLTSEAAVLEATLP